MKPVCPLCGEAHHLSQCPRWKVDPKRGGFIGLQAAVVVAVWAATVAGASWWFYGAGRDAEIATQAREDRAAREATDAALKVTAEAIGRIKVQHRTVQQEVQREVVERAVYRDCKHSDDGLRNINAALTGRAEPAGGGLVPRVDAAEGLKFRGDDPEAGGGGGAVPGM